MAVNGDVIVSPSRREVMGVLQYNLRYTSFSTEKLGYRKAKQEIVENILSSYEKTYVQHGGIELLEESQPMRVIVSGGELGALVCGIIETKEGMLEEHNEKLKEAGLTPMILPQFPAFSILDWAFFRGVKER